MNNSNPEEKGLNNDFKKKIEQDTQEALEKLTTESISDSKKGINIHQGNDSKVVHFVHAGKGNIIHQEASELRKMIKLYKKMIEEKEECIEANRKEFELIIKTKDDEIEELKKEVEFLRREVEKQKA